jgi:hypothetical protein
MIFLIITKTSLEPSINRQVVLDTEIDVWVKSPPCTFKSDLRTPKPTPNPRGPSLRLVALEDPKHIDGLAWTEGPLAVKREIYNTIATHFEISPLFLTAALNQDAVYFKVCLASITNASSDSFEAAPSTA